MSLGLQQHLLASAATAVKLWQTGKTHSSYAFYHVIKQQTGLMSILHHSGFIWNVLITSTNLWTNSGQLQQTLFIKRSSFMLIKTTDVLHLFNQTQTDHVMKRVSVLWCNTHNWTEVYVSLHHLYCVFWYIKYVKWHNNNIIIKKTYTMFNFIGSVMKAMLASSRYYYKIMFVLIFWIHFHLSVYHFSSLWEPINV